MVLLVMAFAVMGIRGHGYEPTIFFWAYHSDIEEQARVVLPEVASTNHIAVP